jgi:hypothetical protein
MLDLSIGLHWHGWKVNDLKLTRQVAAADVIVSGRCRSGRRRRRGRRLLDDVGTGLLLLLGNEWRRAGIEGECGFPFLGNVV